MNRNGEKFIEIADFQLPQKFGERKRYGDFQRFFTLNKIHIYFLKNFEKKKKCKIILFVFFSDKKFEKF